MAGEISVEAVIDRLLRVTGCRSERALSRLFGRSPTMVTSARQRGAVPYREVVSYAEESGQSLDWILLGRGPEPMHSEIAEKREDYGAPAEAASLDLSILIAAVHDAEEVFTRRRMHPSPDGTAQIVAWFYRHYAAADGRREKPPERDVRAMLRLVSSR